MSAEAYWESAPDEIDDYIESYYRKRQEDKKEEVAGWIHQAHLIGESNPMAKKSEMTKPWDIFPELFQEERKEYEEYQFQKAMEKRRERALAWNDRRKHGGF